MYVRDPFLVLPLSPEAQGVLRDLSDSWSYPWRFSVGHADIEVAGYLVGTGDVYCPSCASVRGHIEGVVGVVLAPPEAAGTIPCQNPAMAGRVHDSI